MASSVNQIARCDWLPEPRWSYRARSGLPAVSREKIFPESQIINPLLTKFFQSRWLDIGLIFCEFMDLDSVSVHEHAKKTLTNIQPSCPHTWSIIHISKISPSSEIQLGLLVGTMLTWDRGVCCRNNNKIEVLTWGVDWNEGAESKLCACCSFHQPLEIRPLHDLVTWYGINYAGTNLTQWDFKNKGTRTSPARLSFVLKSHCVTCVSA